MRIRVCSFKLWLLIHVTALNLHSCFARVYVDGIGASPSAEYVLSDTWEEKYEDWERISWKYFYVHNETRITMAMAQAEAQQNGGGGMSDGTTPSSILGAATFPDFSPSKDGCILDSVALDLSFYGSMAWDTPTLKESPPRYFNLEFLAVDSCARGRSVWVGDQEFEISSQEWDKKKASIRIRGDPRPPKHSVELLVRLRARGMDILADGVYFLATGKMHLVGCTFRQQQRPDFSINSTSNTPRVDDFSLSPEIPPAEAYWYDSDGYHALPLNSSALDDCAISATLQYPPLNSRWNWDRFLKFSIRSTRAEDDPHYFAPVEGSAFFPVFARRKYYSGGSVDAIVTQRRIETGGRILLLVLGLVCIALQIKHGRNNEESLPFVSLVMLGIQLANHLSQTSIFKDLQILKYQQSLGSRRSLYHSVNGSYVSFPDKIDDYGYYGIMAWSEHVPYQAMAMAAIFMYVWIFHRVGDRRRIMKLRVLKRRHDAKDPPSDWRVMYLTLVIFSFAGFLGFWVIGADQSGHFRRALTGMTAADDRYFNSLRNLSPYSEDYSPFVSTKFYKISEVHWGFINRFTGLVVSFFLVPQLLGNMAWDLQGRPLSVWFYAGIPFLQSLPHFFSIAKYFQLVPIFSSFDPYINSIYGIYENLTPWWQTGVILCSAMQVLAVHFQFARSLHGCRHSASKTSHVRTCAML